MIHLSRFLTVNLVEKGNWFLDFSGETLSTMEFLIEHCLIKLLCMLKEVYMLFNFLHLAFTISGVCVSGGKRVMVIDSCSLDFIFKVFCPSFIQDI